MTMMPAQAMDIMPGWVTQVLKQLLAFELIYRTFGVSQPESRSGYRSSRVRISDSHTCETRVNER